MNKNSTIFSLIVVMMSILFMAGFHNLDNAWNFNNMNHEFNIDICDHMVAYEKCLTPTEEYVIGILIMIISFIILAFMAIVFYSRAIEKEKGLARMKKKREVTE